MLRAALRLALLPVLVAVARPAAAQRLDLDALPHGELSAIPVARPARLSREKPVEGLWVAIAARPRGAEQWGSLGIWDNPQAAKLFGKGDYSFSSESAAKSCFRVEEALPGSSGAWPLSGTPFALVNIRYKDDGSVLNHAQYPALQAVRVERLTLSGNRAHLDATNLWVDVRSRATRLIARDALDLVRVAGIYPGASVFAARGNDAVHFLIVPSSDEKWKKATVHLAGNQIALEQGAAQGSTTCGHAFLTLRAPIGGGETATARMKVVTQALPKPRPEQQSLAGAVARVFKPDHKGSPPSDDFTGEVTLRGLAVHVSATRPRRERPVSASVAFNWTQEVEQLDF